MRSKRTVASSPTVRTPSRRHSNDPMRKTGWQVHSSVADAVKSAVEAGAAESQNAFVERALIREIREVRRQRVYAAYAAAAEDGHFMSEMTEVSDAYDVAASDGLAAGEV